MSQTLVGVVTGANKGIGLAIVRQLALQHPSSKGPILIYLTSRDPSRGKAALAQLEADPKLKGAKALRADGGAAEIKFHQLDISDVQSVSAFAKYLEEQHGRGGVGFLINNAGIAFPENNADTTRKTLDINYHATMRATRAFLPLLSPTHGRVVNVASTMGGLFFYPPHLRQRFLATKTQQDVSSIMDEYQAAVDAGTQKEAGFAGAGSYEVSKAGLIGASRALASEVEGLLVNSCCPGYVETDINGGQGTMTPDEGAETPVLLAIHDIGGATGTFWRLGEKIDWKDLNFPEGFTPN